MWTRNIHKIFYAEFEDFILHERFHIHEFTSTQVEDMASWLLGIKVYYHKWDYNTATAILVSEPVISTQFINDVKKDLGDDVIITIKEHDRVLGSDDGK